MKPPPTRDKTGGGEINLKPHRSLVFTGNTTPIEDQFQTVAPTDLTVISDTDRECCRQSTCKLCAACYGTSADTA